jgi:hypothetical protein
MLEDYRLGLRMLLEYPGLIVTRGSRHASHWSPASPRSPTATSRWGRGPHGSQKSSVPPLPVPRTTVDFDVSGGSRILRGALGVRDNSAALRVRRKRAWIERELAEPVARRHFLHFRGFGRTGMTWRLRR